MVGEDIFTCESGIHIDGIIKNPSNYEPFDPAEVSMRKKFLIGKKAGRSALRHKLNDGAEGRRKSFDRTAYKAQKGIFSTKDGFYGQ